MRGTIIIAVMLLPAICFSTEALKDTTKKPGTYDQPVLLTSVGRAADVLILKGLCARAEIDFRYCPGATADSLGQCCTLLLVAGGSSKGLGAAKVDVDVELSRVKALVKAARKSEIPILTFHIGGEARRGALSEPFNKLAAEVAELVVVVKSGDEDDFFRKTTDKNQAGYISIDKQIDVVGVLKEIFVSQTPVEEDVAK